MKTLRLLVYILLSISCLFEINLFSQKVKTEGPWQVNEIEIRNIRNIKPKLILKTVRAKKEKVYYKDDVKVDVENLMALGSIERVSVDLYYSSDKKVKKKNYEILGDTNPIKVVYTVFEKPYIDRIVITGNKEFSKSRIKSELTLDEGDFFDELKMREGLFKLVDKYKEKGYLFAKADYEIKIDTSTNKAVLTVKVDEGERIKVNDVEVKNLKSFKKKKIIKQMKNRPNKIYKPDEFENDLKNITDFFKNKGFTNFEIKKSTVIFNPDNKMVNIEITIDEGKKYRFGETSFIGNLVFTSKELKELVEYRKGRIYKQEEVDDTIRNIQEKYADKGYLKVEIEPQKEFDDVNNTVSINYIIRENYPVYVRYIDVEGNKATETHVLKREIVQKEGEVFSLSKIRRSQQKIFNLGFINNVELAVNPTDKPDVVDLVFDVEEGKPGMLTGGAGISSKEGVVGFISVSHMNLFGLAQRFSLNWNFGKRVQDYSVNWTTPWIYDKPTSLGISLFNNRRYRSYSTSYSAYTERRTGGKISLSPRFEDDKYSLYFSYSYERIKVYDIDDIYKNELSEGTSIQSSVYVEFIRDTRDYIWDPTKGTKLSLGLELVGGPFGGDINLYKPNITYSYNKRLFDIDGWPFVLSVGTKFGWVNSFSSTDEVPVYERYFLGGADTIRGYNTNGEIGPLDGGKVYGLSNIEFKFPLAREKKRTVVQWAFFLDVGNSWKHFGDLDLRIGSKERQLKVGAGFGIRFTTPAFPIRLDWGYGFNHKPGEQLSDIYFTIGNVF